MGIWEELNPSNLRYLCYAVTPNETTFASIEDVPDYTKLATIWLFILIATEMLFLKKDQFALNDTVTSANSGVLYLTFKFSGKLISAALYANVYNAIHLVDLDPYNPWVWLLCFLTHDFVYYLSHRAMHECGIFWAFHQAHHSSEYYNLATAIRKGVIQEVGAFGFDLIQCLLIPPQIFLPHKYLNLLFQFWLHTELIPSLGPLEYIINTPSAHRVHHGRNPYCIDRNYGGVLIIWDRMFGTYAAEKKDEKIAYGLVENVRSFNAIWLQWFEFGIFLYGKGAMKDQNGKEYFPGTRQFFWWRYLEDSTLGIPEVDHTLPKYNPFMSANKKLYLFAQFVFLLSYSHSFGDHRLEMDWTEYIAQLIMIISTAQCLGYHFDNDHNAIRYDRLRCFFMIGYCTQYYTVLVMLFAVLNLPSLMYLDNESVLTEEEPKKMTTINNNNVDSKPTITRPASASSLLPRSPSCIYFM